MNVRDLMDELSRYPPHMPVKVLIPVIYGAYGQDGQFKDDREIVLSVDDATEAYTVRHQGNHVLIEGK